MPPFQSLGTITTGWTRLASNCDGLNYLEDFRRRPVDSEKLSRQAIWKYTSNTSQTWWWHGQKKTLQFQPRLWYRARQSNQGTNCYMGNRQGHQSSLTDSGSLWPGQGRLYQVRFQRNRLKPSKGGISSLEIVYRKFSWKYASGPFHLQTNARSGRAMGSSNPFLHPFGNPGPTSLSFQATPFTPQLEE